MKRKAVRLDTAAVDWGGCVITGRKDGKAAAGGGGGEEVVVNLARGSWKSGRFDSHDFVHGGRELSNCATMEGRAWRVNTVVKVDSVTKSIFCLPSLSPPALGLPHPFNTLHFFKQTRWWWWRRRWGRGGGFQLFVRPASTSPHRTARMYLLS